MKFLYLGVIIVLLGCNQEADDLPGTGEINGASSGESFKGKTCQQLEILSWNQGIKKLVNDRCVRCHNENFAWNKVQLQTYELFVENAELSFQRIEQGELSFPISNYEVLLLKGWYGAGMPRSEEDCPQEN